MIVREYDQIFLFLLAALPSKPFAEQSVGGTCVEPSGRLTEPSLAPRDSDDLCDRRN